MFSFPETSARPLYSTASLPSTEFVPKLSNTNELSGSPLRFIRLFCQVATYGYLLFPLDILQFPSRTLRPRTRISRYSLSRPLLLSGLPSRQLVAPFLPSPPSLSCFSIQRTRWRINGEFRRAHCALYRSTQIRPRLKNHEMVTGQFHWTFALVVILIAGIISAVTVVASLTRACNNESDRKQNRTKCPVARVAANRMAY